MRNKKIETPSEIDDDDSEAGDRRIEGMDAAVFSQPVGFIPQFPPPPKYIKVRARNKKTRDFNRVFLAQELQSRKAQEKSANGVETKVEEPRPGIKESQTALWALEFSKDGKYLATGGQDKVVRVWAVISTSEEREAHEMDEEVHIAYADNTGTKERHEKLQAPVFRSTTVREYEGHTADVLDISWSKVREKCLGSEELVADVDRTTSFFPHPWIKRSDYGTSVEQSASALLSIVTSSLPSLSILEMIDSSSRVH